MQCTTGFKCTSVINCVSFLLDLLYRNFTKTFPVTQWMLTNDYNNDCFIVLDEVQWSKGKVSGAVYWGDEKLTDLLVKVLGYFNKFDSFVVTHC